MLLQPIRIWNNKKMKATLYIKNKKNNKFNLELILFNNGGPEQNKDCIGREKAHKQMVG